MTILKRPSSGVYTLVKSNLDSAENFVQSAKSNCPSTSPSGFTYSSYISGLSSKLSGYKTTLESAESALYKSEQNFEDVFDSSKIEFNYFTAQTVKERDSAI